MKPWERAKQLSEGEAAAETTGPWNRFRQQAEEQAQAEAEQGEFYGQGSFGDVVGQGLTFATSDEMAGVGAAIGALFTDETMGDAYARKRDEVRGKVADYKERRPWAAMGGELLGALPTALIPGGAVARGATAGARALQATKAGAVGGALYGYGSGEDGILNRVGNAAIEGGVGAVAGGALSAAGEGVGRVYRAAKDAISPDELARRGVGRQSRRAFSDLMASERISGDELLRRKREFGPDSMAADLSPGFRDKADVLVHFNRPGAAKNLRDPLRERARGRREAASRLFDDVLGPQQDIVEHREGLVRARRQDANRNYEAARVAAKSRPAIDVDPLLEAMLQRSGGGSVPPELMDGGEKAASYAHRLVDGARQARANAPFDMADGSDAAQTWFRAQSLADDVAAFARQVDDLKPSGERPQSLSEFVRGLGGMDVDGQGRAELDAIYDRSRVGLSGTVRKNAKHRSADGFAEAAFEEGYLNDYDMNELLAKLDDDVRGVKTYRESDAALASEWDAYDEALERLEALRNEATEAADMAAGLRETDPSLADFDRLAIAQRRIAERGRGMKGATGDDAMMAAALLGRENRAVSDLLDNASGGSYSNAQREYARGSQVLDASKLGMGTFNASTHPDELRAARRALIGNPAAEEAFDVGARDAARRMLSSSRGDLTAVNQLAAPGSRVSDQLIAAVGPDRAAPVMRRAEGEVQKRLTERIGAGSQTAKRLLDPDSGQGGKVDVAMSIPGLVTRGVQKAVEAVTPQFGRRAEGLSRLLGAQGADGDELLELVVQERLRRIAQESTTTNQVRDLLLGRTLPAAIAGSGTPRDLFTGQ